MWMWLMYLYKSNNCQNHIIPSIDNSSILVRTYSCPSISCDRCSYTGHQPLCLSLSHFSFFFYHIQTLRTYNTQCILLLSILSSPNAKDINLLADLTFLLYPANIVTFSRIRFLVLIPSSHHHIMTRDNSSQLSVYRKIFVNAIILNYRSAMSCFLSLRVTAEFRLPFNQVSINGRQMQKMLMIISILSKYVFVIVDVMLRIIAIPYPGRQCQGTNRVSSP